MKEMRTTYWLAEGVKAYEYRRYEKNGCDEAYGCDIYYALCPVRIHFKSFAEFKNCVRKNGYKHRVIEQEIVNAE